MREMRRSLEALSQLRRSLASDGDLGDAAEMFARVSRTSLVG